MSEKEAVRRLSLQGGLALPGHGPSAWAAEAQKPAQFEGWASTGSSLGAGPIEPSHRRRCVRPRQKPPMELQEERSTGGVVHVPEAGDDHWNARREEWSRHAESAFETRLLAGGRAAAGEHDQSRSPEVVGDDLIGADDASGAGFAIWGQPQPPAAR